ncbi:MAG: polyphenol oxidase family protein [Calditerrivibrio sp.]|nr:polyphenol oxidase family protein [Calditerrivibrio sp.]MCA1932112.1 polyphenol oxidase family protein [Calditerrivibrio sp.]
MLTSFKGLLQIKTDVSRDDILSLTTTRFSGVSRGCYSSNNLRYFTEDENCLENYKLLKNRLHIDNIYILKQIHSAIVIKPEKKESEIVEGDGTFTNIPDLFTGIQTADCFNVQLIGREYVSNLHCGWRSIFLGIIENALELFYKNNDMVLQVIIGPGICEKCYDVGVDLIEKFSKIVDTNFYAMEKGKYYLSLRDIIKFKLGKNKIYNYKDLFYCSSCKYYLYSYRRDGGTTGRMLSILGVKDEKKDR